MSYNGHKNWNMWNVSLWINNDENLYYLARQCIYQYARGQKREVAVMYMLRELQKQGITKTPDGAPYTKTAIRAAMVGL